MIALPCQTQICRVRYASGRVLGAVGVPVALLTLMLMGCSEGSIPVLRGSEGNSPPATAAPADGADSTAAECEQLRAQVRSNQQAVREAPTISTSPEIVAAAEAKADKRIDDTRSRLDELDCPSDTDSSVKDRPLAPMPPAPGAGSP
jgi:hypothetical protein